MNLIWFYSSQKNKKQLLVLSLVLRIKFNIIRDIRVDANLTALNLAPNQTKSLLINNFQGYYMSKSVYLNTSYSLCFDFTVFVLMPENVKYIQNLIHVVKFCTYFLVSVKQQLSMICINLKF